MRARWFSFALSAALLVCSCHRKEAPAPAASATLPEVAAPEALVAELSIGNPKETWLSVRQLGGNAAQALPTSLPVLLAASLSLPPAAAGNIDESVPIVGAILARPEASEPDVVLGMHVTSGPELVASLTLGDAAKFRRVELGPKVVRLVSAPGAREPDGALGVSGNYVLLASRMEALRDAGRYVAEAVAKRARNQPGFSLTATQGVLAGLLSQRLRGFWQARRADLAARAALEQRAKGRPADFADPDALLAGADGTVEAWLSVLESSRSLAIGITPEPGRLRAELSLAPGATGAAAQLYQDLVAGPAAPLLALPQAASAALLWRSAEVSPPAAPSELAASVVKLFGARLTAPQSKQLETALGTFGKARRGATTLALLPRPAPSALFTFELSDEQAFPRAFGEVLRLLELPALRAWLASVWGTPSVVALPEASDGVQRAKVRFAARGGGNRALPPALVVSWQARDGVGRVLISTDESLGLANVASLPHLEASPFLNDSRVGLGDQTALALLGDLRWLAPVGPDEAPFLLAFGKREERLAVSLDVAASALPALARAFALERNP